MMVNKIVIGIKERDVNLEDRNMIEIQIKKTLDEIGFTFEDMVVGQIKNYIV